MLERNPAFTGVFYYVQIRILKEDETEHDERKLLP